MQAFTVARYPLAVRALVEFLFWFGTSPIKNHKSDAKMNGFLI